MSRLLIPLCTLLCCLPAAAMDLGFALGWQYNQDMEIGRYPSPSTPGRPGDKLGLDESAAYTAMLDIPLPNDPDSRLGMLLTHSVTQVDDRAGLRENDIAFTHLHLTGTRYYPVDNWEPFIMAGLGAVYVSPDDGSLKSTTRLSAHIAGGANLKLGEQFLLRLEARWLGTFFNSGGAVLCSGGCTVAFQSEAFSQVQASLGLVFRF